MLNKELMKDKEKNGRKYVVVSCFKAHRKHRYVAMAHAMKKMIRVIFRVLRREIVCRADGLKRERKYIPSKSFSFFKPAFL